MFLMECNKSSKQNTIKGISLTDESWFIFLFHIFTIPFLYITAQIDYLFVHTIIESLAISVSVLIYVFGTKTYEYSRNNLLLFLGITYICVAMIDFFHMLTYQGMNILPRYADANTPTQLWLAARFIEAGAFLVAPSFIEQHPLPRKKVTLIFVTLTVTFFILIMGTEKFPVCFKIGEGLTLFKISGEILICLILAGSFFRFYQKRASMGKKLYKVLSISICLTIMSELSFTLYNDVYGFMNFTGHILKLLSVLMVYKGIISFGLKFPYETIFHDLTKKSEEVIEKNQVLQNEVSLRQQKEHLLQTAYAELDQIFETAAEGMVVIGKDYRIIRINTAFTQLLGLPKENILGRPCFEIFHGPMCHTPECGLKKALGGYPHYEYEEEYQWAPDKKTFGIVTATPFFDHTGTVIGTVESFKDITEWKRMEQEIARSEHLKLVGDIAVGLGHEIRNPLTTVRGFLQICKDKHSVKDQHEIFDLIIDELDHANMVISEFILLSKDKFANKKEINLNNILDSMKPLVHAEARKRNHTVVWNLENIPFLLLDQGEIRQMILHIVRNGLEAMSVPSILTISTSLKESRVILSIKDQGLGIPDEIMQKIGTPFSSTKDSALGLGIPICFAVAERHQASFQIETGPKGTTISTIFPISQPKIPDVVGQ